jgi:hypothetical protein
VNSAGCDPDETVQALLVTRNGGSGLALNKEAIRHYLNGGGQVITERGISSRVVGELLNIPTLEGSLIGDCRSNIQPVVVSRPQDPLWALTPHTPPPEGTSGCGYDLSAIPGVIRLGGWDELSTSLGYIEYGRGRIWLVEANWRDQILEMSDESLALMAAMIAGGGKPVYTRALPECMDLYDNDHDGLIDLFDSDCVSERDVTEWTREVDELPACADGVDNDDDAYVDFPFDPQCESAGDHDEREITTPEGAEGEVIVVAECADGLDNDDDGEIDWPFDAGCSGQGALRESNTNIVTPCNNQQDDDQDGRIDFPADPECLARSWPSELSIARSFFASQGVVIDQGREVSHGEVFRYGCNNGADDDRDGLIDFPADPECLTPRDPDERGESTNLTLEERLRGFTYALPECRDGLDNDSDGSIDLNDVDCYGADDLGPESGQDGPHEVTPACDDLIDNDNDGVSDWPLDPDCLARGADSEDDICASLGSTLISAGERVTFNLLNEGEQHREIWDHLEPISCSDTSQTGQTYHLIQEVSGPLNLEFDAVIRPQSLISLSVRRGCGPDTQVLLCQSLDLSGDEEERSLYIPHLPSGDYLITIGAALPSSWESWARAIDLPPDPRGYQSRDDITSICWQDGGLDSFDCMGRTEVTWRGESISLDVSPGTHTLPLEDHYALRYASERPHPNIWRIRYWGLGTPTDGARLGLRVFGNLGLDDDTIPTGGVLDIDSASLPYTWFVDDLDQTRKPSILTLVVPSQADEVINLST